MLYQACAEVYRGWSQVGYQFVGFLCLMTRSIDQAEGVMVWMAGYERWKERGQWRRAWSSVPANFFRGKRCSDVRCMGCIFGFIQEWGRGNDGFRCVGLKLAFKKRSFSREAGEGEARTEHKPAHLLRLNDHCLVTQHP